MHLLALLNYTIIWSAKGETVIMKLNNSVMNSDDSNMWLHSLFMESHESNMELHNSNYGVMSPVEMMVLGE